MRTALHGLYSGLFDWKEITVSAKESTTTTRDVIFMRYVLEFLLLISS